MTAWAVYNFGRLKLSLNTILNDNYANVVVVEKMALSLQDHEDAVLAILNRDVNNGKVKFTESKDGFFQLFQQASENPTVSEAGPILKSIQSTYEGYLLGVDSLISLANRGDFISAKSFYDNILITFSKNLTDYCFWLIEENQKEMIKVGEQTKIMSDEAIIAVLVASILAFGLSVLMIVQFTKRIIEPAERLTDTVYQIGRGRLDLKIDIQTNDEIGELSREFNKMTERLRQFEELNIEKILSEKQKSETIVQSISDAIIVCDGNSKIQLINRTAEELLNISERHVVGKSIKESISDERIQHICANANDPSSVNQPYLQFHYRGRPVYLRPRISVIPPIHTERSGMVLVLQDVTQFKDLDKAKSDFMAVVSHEFRTPLTSINMALDIIRQRLLGSLTEAQEDLLRSAKQDGERLTKLVRELLQLSKLESGKFEVREKAIDLRKVVESAIQPLSLPFKEKGVEMKLSLEDDLPPLIADEQQLSWVISNLLSNALRYTDKGGCVEIIATPQGGSVIVQVRDTGQGIPQEYIENIFDKFVQVKQSTDFTPGSVGLGLAIAKDIVEMYGGKIWVESEVHKGSTFSFRMPAAQGQAV
ncbi:MAG TPA: ATP-binding protein [Bacteroidota bacterium]|nr:ATP-binding protein [Bacteroidota bacterium]